MPRHTRAPQLETRSSRLKLPIVKKPVFVKVGQGIGLGYRRNSTAGTWVMRVADGKGGNWTKAVGQADDFEDADGDRVLDFWQAQDKARALARDRQGGGEVVKPATVAQALDAYQADLTTRGGDVANVNRVRGHLPARLLDRPVGLLASRELRGWRDGLVKVMAPASVNRTATCLKAALNLAAEHDERIANRRAWESGLATIPDAERSRNVILEEAAVRRLVVEAAKQSLEFALLVETAAVTGARVSQLGRVNVEDLQADRASPRVMMPASRKGRKVSKKLPHRPVPIPADLADRLAAAAAGRAPTAPLLVKPSGAPWKKSDHSRLFKRAAIAAGQDPAEVTIYALRHTSIVRQILAGVPLRVVAVNHDTSVAMIERNYSSHITDHTDELARRAILDLAQPAGGNVVSIRA